MSSGKIKKAKYKYFKNKSKKYYIDVNLNGFLCTCNNREKDCIKEAYNILTKTAEQLNEKPKDDSKENEDEQDEKDIQDELAGELENLKSTEKQKFQWIESGAKNVIFIKTEYDNPTEIAQSIVKDINDSKQQQTRFVIRLVPIERTCKATIDDIVGCVKQLCTKYFAGDKKTFSVAYNHRNNNSLDRDNVIKSVADVIFSINSNHKVDLKSAELTIIVEVIKGFAFIGIVPNYCKFKKYNLHAIAQRETEEKDVQISDKS